MDEGLSRRETLAERRSAIRRPYPSPKRAVLYHVVMGDIWRVNDWLHYAQSKYGVTLHAGCVRSASA